MFEYGGYTWQPIGGELAITSDVAFYYFFGITNNWEKSYLRHLLNGKFLEKLAQNGADTSRLLDITTDLTADTGEKDYGTTTDKITLLSCEQYRRLHKAKPPSSRWVWTVTPHTIMCDEVKCLTPAGFYTSTCNSKDIGVRPIIRLKDI